MTAAVCAALGVSRASVQRRRSHLAAPPAIARQRPKPIRALSDPQQQVVLDLLHAPRFTDQAPAEIYASLLDEGVYHCSIRTMYRILGQHGEVRERREQLRHPAYRKPELIAERPNQVWSWDITKLMGPTKWSYFYLYVILDIFSRRVVGWCAADAESAALFRPLFDDAIAKHNVLPGQLTLHADRGGPMKAKATALLLADLGVTRSHNRPHTSNDNPFSESHFKTLKYQPRFPQRFGCIEDAKSFCRRFFDWYNQQHHHAGIGLMTPDQVHYGQTDAIHARTSEHTRSRVPQQPRALRQQTTNTARQTNRGLDQSTSVNAEDPSLNADPGCIKVVDTFRGMAMVAAATLVAELGDITRFAKPSQLMAYLGLVPSEHSSGNTRRQGGITKAGNGAARRVLIEAAWSYRFPARISREQLLRQESLAKPIRETAWKAQERLCRRYRKLIRGGKLPTVATAAIARELAGFVWAIAQQAHN